MSPGLPLENTTVSEHYASPLRKEWSKEAACSGTSNFGEREADVEVCHSCPVRMLCRAFSIVHKEYGLWGGMTDKERKEFRAANPRAVRIMRAVTEIEDYESPQGLSDPAIANLSTLDIKKDRARRLASSPAVLEALRLADSF